MQLLCHKPGLCLDCVSGPSSSAFRERRAHRTGAQVLHWTRDWGRAQELAWRVAVLYAQEFEQLRDAMLGVVQWLAALRKANTPCALVSHMPAAHVKVTNRGRPCNAAWPARDNISRPHYEPRRTVADQTLSKLALESVPR